MAVFVQHEGTLKSGASYPVPSPAIWGHLDATGALLTPGQYVHIFEDFTTFPAFAAAAQTAIANGWKTFADTGGTGVVADEVGGALTLSSDGDNEGASIATVHYPFQISRSHKKLFFEVMLKTSTIADTKHGIFAGLIDSSTLSATVPIAADGTLADENFVGFHRLEGDGDYFNTVYRANGVAQVTVKDNASAIVVDTYTKLGMIFDPEDSFKLKFFADGVELPDYKTIPSTDGDDFPNDVRLGLVVAVLNATASTPGNTTVGWIRCAQARV